MLATLAAFTALAQAPAALVSDADVETALGAAGLTGRTARFDEGLLRFFRQGEFTTPMYSAIAENPWRAPFLMETKRRELTPLAGRPSEALVSAGAMVGFAPRRTLVGNPIAYAEEAAGRPGALKSVLERMRRAGLIRTAIPPFDRVPAPVQRAAALVLNVAMNARDMRKTALRPLGDLRPHFARLSAEVGAESDAAVFAVRLEAYRQTRLPYLIAAGHDLTLAAQNASAYLSTVPASAVYDLRISTAWGLIRLTGGKSDRHPAGASLLVIDTGGNDIYLGGGANASADNWCSVSIDAAGNDRYVSDPALLETEVSRWRGRRGVGRPGPGGALLGVAVLVDMQGDDSYRTHRPGLGSGHLGVGVLLDRSGTDRYDGYQDAMGYGMFGAGILEDDAGNDTYLGFNQIQGIGQTNGLGLLVDRSGDDRYAANNQIIDFPSPQNNRHNVSMAQGSGNGRRADYLDLQSLAGGVGVLYDLAGNDRYSCGVFGQGVGYWMGVGMLWDTGGTDTYDGQWYVQGTAAHFAVGYLEDEAGDDKYTAPLNMAQGAGHDFSLGVLLDRGGDDDYKAPNLSLGAGNANGLGWFMDLEGNDDYTSSGTTLGRAAEAPKGSLRERALTLGLFFDLAGRDTYPEAATWARNNQRGANWTDKGPTPSESQVGVFWDR